MKTIIKPISFSNISHSIITVGLVLVQTLVMGLIGPKLLGEGVIALFYLTSCAWATLRYGKVAGASAALTAALCFDFFFIPPYYTFSIGSIEGWLLLFLFMAASILVVGRFQTILGNEKNRERKATFLYEVVAAIANQPTRQGVAGTVANKFEQIYLAKLVQVYLYQRGPLPALMVCPGNQTDCVATSKPDRVHPINSGPEMIGEIAIWKGIIPLPADNDPMFNSILHQIAAALDRVQALEETALKIVPSRL
jgi:K+-sensing histidine kinase KdpD